MASESARRSLRVELGDRSYEIRLGRGLLSDLGPFCRALGSARTALLVTDAQVAPHHMAPAAASLRTAGYDVTEVVLPPGEATKTEPHLFELYRRAIAAGIDRSGLFVALGGGVIGDLTGFAAATYLRGVPYVQVPTTLLAMVDSSVGGKTAIDLPEGKNLVGAFHQPVGVLADLDTLDTLPPRELAAGMAEVVKYGVIRDAALFELLEQRLDAPRTASPGLLEDIVLRCCHIKAEVVAGDEREVGLRAILNFGHTLGHAVETLSAAEGLRHGEAVAIGMVYAAHLSERVMGWPPDDTRRLTDLLCRYGLPVMPPSGLRWSEVRATMSVDKKARAGRPRFVLGERIGCVRPGLVVDEALLEETWYRVGGQ